MPDHRPTIEQLSDADIDKTIKGTHRITRKPIEPAHAPRETGPTSHPWKWEYSSEYRGYCLIGSRRQMICCFQDDSTIPPHEDQSLIAAAPELLEALRELAADKYLSDPINNDRMAKARAAIAKAVGHE